MQHLHHLRLAENDAWHAPLRQQVFHDAVEHGGLINSLRVEPGAGLPGGRPASSPWRPHRAEGWDISGHKIYTTGIEGCAGRRCRAAKAMITRRWWARAGAWRQPGHQRGGKRWDHAGMRATRQPWRLFLTTCGWRREHAVDVWPTDAPPAAQAEPFRLFANRQTALLAAIWRQHCPRRSRLAGEGGWRGGCPPVPAIRLSSATGAGESRAASPGCCWSTAACWSRARPRCAFPPSEANLAKVTITDNAIPSGEYRARADRQSWSQPTKPAGTPLHRNAALRTGTYPHRATAPGWQPATSSFNHKDNHDASIDSRPVGGRADPVLALGGYTRQRRSGLPCVSPIKAGRHAFAAGGRPTPCKISFTTVSGPSPGRRSAGGSPQRGRHVDAGIIGDAPLLFALANGAPVKAIAVDKSTRRGPRCWYPRQHALPKAALI